MNKERIICCVCGKQVVKNQIPNRNDKYTTILEGSKAGFGNQVFCGYCAEDLDEDGLFPNERF